VRANVLVVGAGAGVVSAMLGALASCAPAGERLVVARDADEIAIAQGQVIPLHLTDDGARAEKVVQAAARLGADRLVIASLGGAVAAATIDAIAEGCEGVLAGLGATSLRHALARLVSEVALAKPGASLAAVREVVGESFDVAVEVAHGADGRPRVLRIAELAGSDAKEIVARDLFVLSAEGAGIVTAATPRLVGDFAARGVKLEAAAPSLRDGPHPGRTSLGRRTRAAPGARQP
jgi:pilus assembly protein CpaF